ncbi:MAG: hypothetical protein ACM3XO_24885 [Bacteroidota bacterium]
MGRPLTDLTFEEWVLFVFDHPFDESRLEWYWEIEADWWEGPASRTIQYLTRAFENAAEVFRPYSDSQLNRGLWYLASNACSDHMLTLLDLSLPWSERRRCIRSIYTLYEQCFAPRCTPHLSHLDEAGVGPLNSVCYMWWDILPVYGQPGDPSRRETDAEILQVLESALQLEPIACRECALHGLGHWGIYYPDQVQATIDRFLQRQKDLPEGLRTYALNAHRGCVL